MVENEVNELLSLVGKEKTLDTNFMRELLQKLCPSVEICRKPNEVINKESLVALFNEGVADQSMEERLFLIFYSIDQGKYRSS